MGCTPLFWVAVNHAHVRLHRQTRQIATPSREGINCVRLFKRYKSEEQREIQAQQANLERQREENQRMMQELMEMKARLEEKEKTPEEPPQA